MERVFFNSAEIPFDRAVIIKKKPSKKTVRDTSRIRNGTIVLVVPVWTGGHVDVAKIG